MRSRSLAMQRLYRERVPFVKAFLEAHPICQRCSFEASTEVHEVKSRSRGGSILDEDNCRALCHVCHRFVTEHPRQAEAEGFSKPSWVT